MVRLTKALLTFLACIAVGCAVAPNVVTVVKPYVAVIAIDNPEGVTWLGMMRCDIANRPFILVNPRQTPEQFESTILHERYHVADVERFGSCRGFVERYAADSLFRLRAEAFAFCSVYRAQITAGVAPMPPLKTIVWVLHNRYASDYTEEAVEEAIERCR
jgi:hypothetical protein